MSNDDRSAQAVPAGGSPVDRGVGRLTHATPQALGSTERVDLLPKPDVPLVRGGCYTAALVRQTVEARVGAERERIRRLVEDVRAANAASQDADDCLTYTTALHRAWVALMAGLEGSGDQQELFRHTKTGGVYAVVCNATRESDGAPLVVYRNLDTGALWVRPADEFHDGRFERVA